MGIQDIKDRLNTDKYEFLRTDPRLGENILILTTAGSIAFIGKSIFILPTT